MSPEAFSSRQTSHLMKPSQCSFPPVTLGWSPEHISFYSLNKMTHQVLPSVILSILCHRRWSVVFPPPLHCCCPHLFSSLTTKFQGHIGNSKASQQGNNFPGLPWQSKRLGDLNKRNFFPPVQEAASPRCQCDWFPPRPLTLVGLQMMHSLCLHMVFTFSVSMS